MVTEVMTDLPTDDCAYFEMLVELVMNLAPGGEVPIAVNRLDFGIVATDYANEHFHDDNVPNHFFEISINQGQLTITRTA